MPSLGVVTVVLCVSTPMFSKEFAARASGGRICRLNRAAGEAYRTVLPVRSLIHCGTGRFCFCAFAIFCLVRNDLWLCYTIVSLRFFRWPSSGHAAPASKRRGIHREISKRAIEYISGHARLLAGVRLGGRTGILKALRVESLNEDDFRGVEMGRNFGPHLRA